MELIIPLLIVAVLAAGLVTIYNRLVSLKNRFQNAFAQIQVQLKRRYDLIPNLVEIAKGYLAHERGTLEAVVEARNRAAAGLEAAAADPTNADAIKSLGSAETTLRGTLGQLNVVVEDYPELKGNENMSALSEELASTENRVAFARQSYNDQVMEYNTFRQSFPSNFLAPLLGHREDATLLQFEDEAAIQSAPEVTF